MDDFFFFQAFSHTSGAELSLCYLGVRDEVHANTVRKKSQGDFYLFIVSLRGFGGQETSPPPSDAQCGERGCYHEATCVKL